LIKIRVIMRCCDSVQSLHGTQRPFGLDKRQCIRVCFGSLLESLQGTDHEIDIIGDALTQETISFLMSFAHLHTIRLHNSSQLGNVGSLLRALDVVNSIPPEEYVYMVEDDYFHRAECFQYIVDFLNVYRGEFFLHPPDYPDRYTERPLKPVIVLLTHHTHWRQVYNTTFTFFGKSELFHREMGMIRLAAAINASDGLLSTSLYTKVQCFSPIPGLSTHMHVGVMTPLVDWEPLVRRFLAAQ